MSRQTVARWMKDALPKRCCNCGSEDNLVYHHIVPVELGGNDVLSNIAVVCGACHGKIHYGKDGAIVHGELIRKGIEEARKRGVRVGRKPVDAERIMRLISEKSTQFNGDSITTEREIMEEAGVSATCYHKCKRALLKLMSSDSWPYDWQKPIQVSSHPKYERVIKREQCII